MFFEAFIVAFSLFVLKILDDIFGNQTCARPIVVGTAVGIACGDIKTGVLMGAQLEAIYMGVSAFGGVMASDYTMSTAIGVGLACITKCDMETALAITVPIGTIINTLKPVKNGIMDMLTPLYKKYEQKGEYGRFYALLWGQTIVFQELFDCALVFLCVFFGSDAVEAVIAALPDFILNGLNTSASVLVVVGLALLTQCVWTTTTPVWVILGFILFKYLGFTNTTCAVVGACVAMVAFKRSQAMNELRLSKRTETEITDSSEEDDDFYA